ncbi:DEAD/DEAH box helicase [Thermicanus aegyptius]|uniref:DEAD/DEAH box helicase n=1 Tax=Thermicanus aegyptius TaxID=94009 RepID=UPI0003FE7D40|nr:SNF2-related protein [Thermicanus aegyptius]
MTPVPVRIHHQSFMELERRMREDGPWDSWTLFQMAYRAEEATAIKEFHELQSLKALPHLNLYPHQKRSIQKVLFEMHGRALLADEVGLGKTIEAGLILKEYLLRGLVKKSLILVPSSLVLQWQRELADKCLIPAIVQRKAYMWEKEAILIASIDTAKREPHRSHVLNQEYDMLIIDEAHKLKNEKTKNYQFVKEIRKKYCLLLTATPIQNELSELYNLITLLKPGYLGSTSEFQGKYVEGKRESKNSKLLKMELDRVMIRNRKADSGISLPKRNVVTVPIELTPEERLFYEKVTSFVRQQYREKGIRGTLPLITLQRELTSSKDATYLSLIRMLEQLPPESPLRDEIGELVEIGKRVTVNTKAKKAVELIQEINDKVILFTQFRGTMNYLQHYLHEHGITSIPFRGGFGRNKKDWMRELFEKRAQVLVATEAGGEGINLQFCNRIINYDLPWNPMKIEQRIGRIHRLGQRREVTIYNLTTLGTVEEAILHLLYEKIDLFEIVIGQLDTILERLPKGTTLETHLIDIFMGSRSEQEMRIKLENVSEVFHSIRRLQEETGEDRALKEVSHWINKR